MRVVKAALDPVKPLTHQVLKQAAAEIGLPKDNKRKSVLTRDIAKYLLETGAVVDIGKATPIVVNDLFIKTKEKNERN